MLGYYNLCNYSNKADGEIIFSQKKRNTGSKTTVYDIRYMYFLGKYPNYGSKIKNDLFTNDVDFIVKSYPVGKKITVFYDSRYKGCSIVQNSKIDFSVMVDVFVIVFSSVFLALCAAWACGGSE